MSKPLLARSTFNFISVLVMRDRMTCFIKEERRTKLTEQPVGPKFIAMVFFGNVRKRFIGQLVQPKKSNYPTTPHVDLRAVDPSKLLWD